ncbi:MAG: hypothetical protein D6743_01170 [Calditrichaeota bacterium]|nr:MAG: hypothetical protein D6743_01170 [Calditrichota bacterium]
MMGQKQQLSGKWTVVVLACLLVCAIYLRFVNLGAPSFWVDEMNHVYAGMSLSKGEAPRFPSGVPNERALPYSRLVAWSFSLFGVNEFAARLPSAVFGLLAIVLVFWVGQEWFGRRVGLIAAFVLTFAHPAIGWSRTCRMYTLFQLLFLLGVFLFYKGFEAETTHPLSPPASANPLLRLRALLYNQGVRWPWLAASGLVFLLSLTVHQLTGLFAVTVVVFCAAACIGVLFTAGVAGALRSKYFIALVLAGVAMLVGGALFDLKSFLAYALSFQPDWAKYAKVEDTHYYYWLLTASDQFPLAALFLLGTLQALARVHKTAIFAVLTFGVPVFLQSFVFSYKTGNYIFNIYPFYVLLIAFAASNVYELELNVLPRAQALLGRLGEKARPGLLKGGLVLLLVAWVPLTVWFRFAVHIPRNGAAGPNGAITHNDWKGALRYVSQHAQPGDVIASTLPLTVLYYFGRVDYNLNLAHLDESLKWTTPATDGRHNEFYTGVPSIESVEELQQVMAAHARGWLVVDNYRFGKKQYITPVLSAYIEQHLNRVWQDRKKTVTVYSWSEQNLGKKTQ